MEFDDQSERDIQELHVAEQLCFVNRQNLLHRLELKQKASLDKNVEAQGFIKHQSFLFNPDKALIDGSDMAQLELTHQAPFVDAFNQTWPFETVNFYCRSNGRAAQLVSLLK